MTTPSATVTVEPGHFEPAEAFYQRTLNAQIHPLVRYFMDLGNARIAERFCHLHPEVDATAVHSALSHVPRYFRWGGADLFHVTTERGARRIVIIETNSSPSGQKSMPILHEREEQGGYRTLLERAFAPLLKRRPLPRGELAVLWDKNPMEVAGYAAALADLCDEPVHLVHMPERATRPTARFDESGTLEVQDAGGTWHPIRGALRYVTQRPWNRIPPLPRTALLNPVLCCLAGGRNKLLAAKAYDFFNGELQPSGLRVRVPETIWDVTHQEVPIWVARMGGVAVVKDPYSNAGQGVFTITGPEELEDFMGREHRYDRFIVQALIGNVGWSSRGRAGRLYHVGTIPQRAGQIYVADLRFMVGASPDGFFPVAIYARRAPEPLAAKLSDASGPSWNMLGTNLSFRREDGSWDTDPSRLMLMDSRDFNRLGVGLDDLIEAYLQTVLAVTAIDRMAVTLVTTKGRFRRRLFASLNPDPTLLKEICE